MPRLAPLSCLVAGCVIPPAPPTVTTPATLEITPDTTLSRRNIGPHPLSAYVQPAGDGWQLVLANAPVCSAP